MGWQNQIGWLVNSSCCPVHVAQWLGKAIPLCKLNLPFAIIDFFFLGKGGKGKNWLSGKPPFTLLPLLLRVKVENFKTKFFFSFFL